MVAAAERWDFEYAGVVRDRAARLERLRDEFGQLREALEGLSFLYHVPGVGGPDRIYLVRRGTVRAVVDTPTTQAERRRLQRLTDEHFGTPEPATALVSRHQVDEILLIARWFRLNPDELARTVAAERVDAAPRSA
jgi:excinuclease ABC subunit C